jgi:hypothetical protein
MSLYVSLCVSVLLSLETHERIVMKFILGSFTELYLCIPALIKMEDCVMTCISFSTHIECNALNICRSENCIEQNLRREIEDTFYVQYAFPFIVRFSK